MISSNFHHEIVEVDDRQVIMIKDLDMGNISVTNDIENVVEWIAKRYGIDPEDYIIIYLDSTRVWDGWHHKTQSFVPLQKARFADAFKKYIQQEKTNPLLV